MGLITMLMPIICGTEMNKYKVRNQEMIVFYKYARIFTNEW